MYILYFSPGACSTAAHVLLEECGAEYEIKQVALAKGEQRTEEYRKINAHGKVPALVVDGEVITQNAAILPFIAESVNTLEVSWKEAEDINEFVCSDALVIPNNTLSPEAGFLFCFLSSSFALFNSILSTSSPFK